MLDSSQFAGLIADVPAVLVGDKNIMDVCELPITGAKSYLGSLILSESERKISAPILKEIQSRLEFLENVGLDYLNLARESATLSGGESQRIRLARCTSRERTSSAVSATSRKRSLISAV